MQEPPRTWDAVVVGGGPAGLSAAAWLGRYRRSTLVFDGGEYRNRWTNEVHGYLGLDPIPPSELLERSRSALKNYDGIEIRGSDVLGIEQSVEGFNVSATDGDVLASRIILATGVVDLFPDIEGFEDHYGKNVFHCPDCDGFEARGKEVVVLGWSEDIAGFAAHLFNWAKKVTIVTDGRPFEADEARRERLAAKGVLIVEDRALRLEGDPGRLQGVSLETGDRIPCDLVFFALGETPRSDLGKALGCATDDQEYLLVDEHGRTTVTGVYAAGDVTPGEHLVQVAAAEGTIAGIACAKSLNPPRAEPA